MGLFDDLFKKQENPVNDNEFKINAPAMLFSQNGLIKYHSKDYISAISDFTKAIEAQPSNQNFYIMRGTAHEDNGNDENAESDFIEAAKLDPTNFVAAYRLGMLYFRQKDLRRAIGLLKISYDNSPHGNIDHLGLGKNNILFVARKLIAGNLANFLTQVNLFEQSLIYSSEAIELDPDYANPYTAKGLALAQTGHMKEGIEYLKKAEQLGSNQAAKLIKILTS